MGFKRAIHLLIYSVFITLIVNFYHIYSNAGAGPIWVIGFVEVPLMLHYFDHQDDLVKPNLAEVLRIRFCVWLVLFSVSTQIPLCKWFDLNRGKEEVITITDEHYIDNPDYEAGPYGGSNPGGYLSSVKCYLPIADNLVGTKTSFGVIRKGSI